MWASDYKTGGVDLNDTRDFWTSQMLYYFLVLKMKYPGKNVILTYAQMKSFKDGKYGLKGFIGDTEIDHPLLNLAKKGNTVVIAEYADWSIDRIKEETLSYASYLSNNYYPLTERDEQIACKYCEYERVCRKTSLPR